MSGIEWSPLKEQFRKSIVPSFIAPPPRPHYRSAKLKSESWSLAWFGARTAGSSVHGVNRHDDAVDEHDPQPELRRRLRRGEHGALLQDHAARTPHRARTPNWQTSRASTGDPHATALQCIQTGPVLLLTRVSLASDRARGSMASSRCRRWRAPGAVRSPCARPGGPPWPRLCKARLARVSSRPVWMHWSAVACGSPVVAREAC